MKRFYESQIEVMLCDVFSHHFADTMCEIEKLERIRSQYLEGSQQYIFLTTEIKNLANSARTGKCGFVGSHYNCAFSTMYQVFGIDVIGFLFDRPWVPFVEIARFNLPQFLQRLSVLERSYKALKQGDELPVSLSEPEPNLWAASVHGRPKFSDELHGFFLIQAFRELRDFAQASKTLKSYREAAKRVPVEFQDDSDAEVFINLVDCYADHDADTLAYAEYRRKFGLPLGSNALQ